MTRQVMELAPSDHHDDCMLTATSSTPLDTSEPRLRLVLTTNATTSGLGGFAALALGGPVDTVLGTDSAGWVRIVGAGLVVFAAFVAWVARSDRPRLIRETPAISAGDIAWVVGTIATIGLGWYSLRGAVVMGLVGATVGSFGLAQALLVRRLRSDD